MGLFFSDRQRRIAGYVYMISGVGLSLFAYGLAFGCPACFGGDSGTSFPKDFWLSCAIQKPPTYYLAVVTMSIMAVISYMIGEDRCKQVEKVLALMNPDQEMVRHNKWSRIYNCLFSLGLAGTALCPISHVQSHFYIESVGFGSGARFFIMQIFNIEPYLVSRGVVSKAMNKRRSVLLKWLLGFLVIAAYSFALTGVYEIVAVGSDLDVLLRIVSVASELTFLLLGMVIYSYGELGCLYDTRRKVIGRKRRSAKAKIN